MKSKPAHNEMRNRRFSWGSFFVFWLVCFWPIGFYIFAIGQGLILLPVIARESDLDMSYSQFFFDVLIFLVLPVAVVVIAYHISVRLESWKRRWLTIYMSWVVLVFIVGFAASAAIGGVSMAAVEGVAGTVFERYLSYAGFAVQITMVSHIAIIPWSIISLIILRRLEGKVFSDCPR